MVKMIARQLVATRPQGAAADTVVPEGGSFDTADLGLSPGQVEQLEASGRAAREHPRRTPDKAPDKVPDNRAPAGSGGGPAADADANESRN